jgi:hypothetical protein
MAWLYIDPNGQVIAPDALAVVIDGGADPGGGPGGSDVYTIEAAAARAAVFGYYGRACACCSATEDLTIDHVNGGGEEHRRKVGIGRGVNFYAWLVRRGFPDGFQTMCRRCNSSKSDGPACRIDHTKNLAAAGE